MITPESKALVFDIGNVLIGWEPFNLYKRYFSSESAMNDFFDEVGFYEWNLQQDAGRSFAEAVLDLSEKYPHWAEEIAAYDRYWEESVSGPIQDTVELLQGLHAKGYTLYALSNWSAEKYPTVQERYSFLDCFDHTILSGSVGMIKPDHAIFRLLLDRTGRRAEECLFIDDSLANIEAADALNFDTHHFKGAPGLRSDLVQRGYKV